jgi:signal transduction histidine kinase/CheY-like chemotaxis protein
LIPFADFTHPEDVEADVGLYRNLRDGALDRYDLEKRFLHADGTVRWGRLTCTAVRGPDGDFSHAVALVEDITERKALEEQLLHAQKLDAVGRLAGGVAHDFNNLLTALGGHAEFLVAGLDPDDPRRREAEEIRRIGERAANLTRHLLAFSRRQMLQPRVLDLAEVVAELEKMLTRLIGEHIELRSVTAPDLWPVEADPGQLEQVVVNLIVNARDAMPTGGQLTIELANAEVADGADGALPGRYVRVVVADTGLGLDPGVREHLFEPFFTTKELGKGTGLGLATSYGIVEQSGGFIRVESEPNRGTRFEVYLPASDSAAKEPAPLPTDAGGGRETVMLVEDEQVVRDVVHQMLERQGYEVLVAGDGEEALALAEQHEGQIDVLATDVVMPRMNGGELADRLLLRRPGLRILFMSGYAEDPAVWEGREERKAFLQKPFTAGDLGAALRGLLAAGRTG